MFQTCQVSRIWLEVHTFLGYSCAHSPRISENQRFSRIFWFQFPHSSKILHNILDHWLFGLYYSSKYCCASLFSRTLTEHSTSRPDKVMSNSDFQVILLFLLFPTFLALLLLFLLLSWNSYYFLLFPTLLILQLQKIVWGYHGRYSE